MCKKLVCLVSVVLVVGLAGSALAAHPNLVAWWPFDSDYDNAQGDSGLDGSANGGGVSITTTGGEYIRGGGALKIDDDTTSTNYVDVTDNVLESDQQVATIVAWYKYSDISSDGSDERGFIWETTPGYSSGFAVRSANSDGTGARDAEWFFDPDPTLPSGFSEYHRDDDGPIISDGSWHHVAMVWNQTNDYIKYYHDGAMEPVFSLVGDNRNLVNSSGLHIGNHRAGDGARAYDGFIDDMAVYDVELSAACVKALYDGSFGGQSVDPDNVLYIVEELKAWSPSLSYGAMGVDRNANISWSAGEYAADTDGHDVYFGTNESDVSAGTGGTSKGRQTETTYEPGTLDLDTTYYWVIDEVNDANGDSPWLGDVLNFDVKNCTADMKKGPYLIYEGTNTEMTVLWQLSSTQSCNIAWGLDTNYSTGNSNTSEYGGDHQHKYSITSLTPGTKYYYKVTVGSDYSIGSFRTAPASDATSTTF